MQQTGLDSMPPRAPRASTDNPPKKRAPRQLPTGDIPPDDLPAVIGHNLKVARLKHAMTLEDVAKAVGMTNQGVSKIEMGKTSGSVTTLKRLADAVGMDIADLLKPPENQPSPSPEKKPIR